MIVSGSCIRRQKLKRWGYNMYVSSLRPIFEHQTCYRKYIKKNLAIEVDVSSREVKAFKNKRTYYGRMWTQLPKVRARWVKEISHYMVMDADINEK